MNVQGGLERNLRERGKEELTRDELNALGKLTTSQMCISIAKAASGSVRVRLGGHSKKKEFDEQRGIVPMVVIFVLEFSNSTITLNATGGDEGQLSKEDSVFNDFGKRRRLEDDKKKKQRQHKQDYRDLEEKRMSRIGGLDNCRAWELALEYGLPIEIWVWLTAAGYGGQTQNRAAYGGHESVRTPHPEDGGDGGGKVPADKDKALYGPFEN
ncbi:hypothetical protein BY996DRAFT_6445717 [Phakopsora pachyrhizi]|nr:hypothetical protein BY996DRAFT_6445717 [Phakopsora pachyrhizi]